MVHLQRKPCYRAAQSTVKSEKMGCRAWHFLRGTPRSPPDLKIGRKLVYSILKRSVNQIFDFRSQKSFRFFSRQSRFFSRRCAIYKGNPVTVYKGIYKQIRWNFDFFSYLGSQKELENIFLYVSTQNFTLFHVESFLTPQNNF